MKNTLVKAIDVIPVTDSEVACPSLSLNLNESSIVSMIGPESSGKTLWLKTLIGLNAMAQGELALLQYDIRQLNRQDWLNLKKEVSYVGQDTALLSAYTLMENILLPALYHKLASRDELTRQAYLLLDEIGFNDKAALNKLPAFTSPLQNYFIKMVRALIVQPRLLFLDDLYAHLSLDRVLSLKQFLKHKVDKTGLSIVLTTSHVKQVIDESTVIVFLSPEVVGVYQSKQDLLEASDEPIKEYLSSNDIH